MYHNTSQTTASLISHLSPLTSHLSPLTLTLVLTLALILTLLSLLPPGCLPVASLLAIWLAENAVLSYVWTHTDDNSLKIIRKYGRDNMIDALNIHFRE